MLSSGMSAITYNSWLLRLTPSVLPHSLCLCYFCAWVCLVMCNRYVCEFACDYIWCVSLFFFLSLFMLKIGCNVSLVCISRLFGLFQSFLPRIFKALRLFNLSTYISPSFVSSPDYAPLLPLKIAAWKIWHSSSESLCHLAQYLSPKLTKNNHG